MAPILRTDQHFLKRKVSKSTVAVFSGVQSTTSFVCTLKSMSLRILFVQSKPVMYNDTLVCDPCVYVKSYNR